MNKRNCVVCGIDTSHDSGRCTNGCCTNCHRQFCTPGGITSPGHGLDVKAARVKLREAMPSERRVKKLREELACIEDSLANPVEQGRDWDRRRASLLQREEQIKKQLRGPI